MSAIWDRRQSKTETFGGENVRDFVERLQRSLDELGSEVPKFVRVEADTYVIVLPNGKKLRAKFESE